MRKNPLWRYNSQSAIGALVGRLNRSSWHELAVRAVLYTERHHSGPLRYSTVSNYLFDWGVQSKRGTAISVGTLKRTLKRQKCRRQLVDFRENYSEASDAELLQFDPALANTPEQLKELGRPAEVEFETVEAISQLLSQSQL